MSDNKGEDILGGLIGLAMVVLFVMWIVNGVVDWVDDNTEEIINVLTMIGVTLGGALTIFILWKLISFARSSHAEEQKRSEERGRTRREKGERESQEASARSTERQARDRENNSKRYAAWLMQTPVDSACNEAGRHLHRLEGQLTNLRGLATELQARDTNSMLPTHRAQHDETLAAVQEGMKIAATHARVWRGRLVVLTAQRMLQCALRSIPPWLGGAPFDERPSGTGGLWPTKPADMTAATREAHEARDLIVKTRTSMREVERQMAPELGNASVEARQHLQTLLERADTLHTQLSMRLVECQTHEDRRRAMALLSQGPTERLAAGELDAFFPKDIEPIDTRLLMSVPQSLDLEDKLRELRAAAAHNAAAGSADHEVEALTQAPGGHVLPPRRPKTTR